MKPSPNKSINNYNSSVNTDKIWTAIKPRVIELNRKNKRRKIIFFWFFGVLFLSGITALLVFNQLASPTAENSFLERVQEQNPAIYGSSIEKTDNVKNKDVSSSAIEYLDKPESQIINENKSTSDQKKRTSSIVKTTSQNIKANKSENTLLNNNASVDVNQQSAVNQFSESATASSASRNDAKSSTAEEPDTQLSTRTTQEGFSKQLVDNHSTSNHSTYLSVRNQDFSSQDNKNVGTTEAKITAEKNAGNIQNEDILRPALNLSVNNLPRLSLYNLETNFAIHYIKLLPPLANSKNQANSNKKAIQFYANLTSGIFLVTKKLAHDQGASTIQELRSNTEKTLEVVDFGLDFGFKHYSGINVSLGYHQLDINERFDATYVERDTSYKTDVRQIIINELNGDTVNVVGQVPIWETSKTTDKVYNKYRLREIPISLGYMKSYDKWSIGIHGGVSINLALKTSGTIYGTLDDRIDLSTDVTIYKDKIGLGYHFGLTCQRALSSKFSIGIAPQVKFYPNLMAVNQSLSVKYTLIGGSLGLLYRLP